MSQHAAIIHGSGGSEHSFWIPWLRTELENAGYSVWTPSIPSKTENSMSDRASFLATNSPHNSYDLVIGHSSGVPLLLHLLSHSHLKASKMIGVAGFLKPLTGTDEINQKFLAEISTARAKDACEEFLFIHSDNDPWGCDIAQGEYMAKSLDGKLIIKSGEGHFGSDKFNQPYKEFPDLLTLHLNP